MERRQRSAWSLPTTLPLGLAAPGTAQAYPARAASARTVPVACLERGRSHKSAASRAALSGASPRSVSADLEPRTGANATRNACISVCAYFAFLSFLSSSSGPLVTFNLSLPKAQRRRGASLKNDLEAAQPPLQGEVFTERLSPSPTLAPLRRQLSPAAEAAAAAAAAAAARLLLFVSLIPRSPVKKKKKKKEGGVGTGQLSL